MNGFKKLSILFTTLAFFPAMAAQRPVVTPIGKSWPKIIDALQKKGIHHVGALDLQKLMTVSKGIKWITNPALPPQQVTGNRRSAYFDADKKEVHISANLPKDEASSMPNLELHETFGALGVDDHAYKFSTALNTLSQIDDGGTQKRLADDYGKSIFTVASIGGGGSVSGGGDLTALFVKNKVLQEIMKDQKNLSWVFLTEFPRIDFEPIYDPKFNEVAIRYEFRDASSVGMLGTLEGASMQTRYGQTYEDMITVYIPIANWNAVNDRPLVLREIENKIMAIFPVSTATTEVKYEKAGCDPARNVTFPATNDVDIQMIQEERLGMLNGCGPVKGNFGITVPSLPQGDAPEDVKINYYDCMFGAWHQVLTANKGSHALTSFDGETSDGTSVDNMLVSRPDNGGIEQLMMAYSDQPNGPRIFLHGLPSANGSAQIKTVIHGESVVFSCKPKQMR